MRVFSHHSALQHLHAHNHKHSYVGNAANLATRTIADVSSLVRRQSTSSLTTCAPDNNTPICAKPTNVNDGLIIGIAAA